MIRKMGDFHVLILQLLAHKAFLVRKIFGKLGSFILRKDKGIGPDSMAELSKTVNSLRDIGEVNPLDILLLRLMKRALGNSREISETIGRIFTLRSRKRLALAYLKLSEACVREDQLDDAITALKNAVELEPNNPELRYRLGKLQVKSKRFDDAILSLEETVKLEPSIPRYYYELASAYVEIGSYGDALESARKALELKKAYPELRYLLGKIYFASGKVAEAVEEFKETLRLDPSRTEAFIALEKIRMNKGDIECLPHDNRLLVSLESDHVEVNKGESFEVSVNVSTKEHSYTGLRLFCFEPYGLGVTTNSRLREINFLGPEDSVEAEYSFVARRPSYVNLGNPWEVRFVVTDGENYNYAILRVDVEDTEEGKIFFLITEDHELFEHQRYLSPREARLILIDKSSLAESIANKYGIKWTHMIEGGSSYKLIEWASKRDSGSGWKNLLSDVEDYFSNVTYKGNDLELHIHGFNMPESSNFAYSYEEGRNLVELSDSFLSTHTENRGFWSRIYDRVEGFDNPQSRTGSLFSVIKVLEHIGRLGDPSFRISFFRAGSLDFGDDNLEQEKSILSLRKLGILADSSLSKSSVYAKIKERSAYFSSPSSIREEAKSLVDLGILEVRAEYNIEGDYLSDTRVLNKVVERKYKALLQNGKIKPGVHFITSISHDKYINRRMGRDSNSLDPNYGDWKTIDGHLNWVSKKLPRLRFARTQDALLEYYDHHTPELMAWRTNEQVYLVLDNADSQEFRYDVHLLGKDILVDENHTHRVSIKPPSYFSGLIERVEILKDGACIKSFSEISVYPDLEFTVDNATSLYAALVRVKGIQGPFIDREKSRVSEGEILLEIVSNSYFRKANLLLRKEILNGLLDNLNPRRVSRISVSGDGGSFTPWDFRATEDEIQILSLGLLPQNQETQAPKYHVFLKIGLSETY